MRRPILKKNRIRFGSETCIVGLDEDGSEKRTATALAERTPDVHYRRRGEIVEAIEITCPCGHSMVLECDYEAFEDDLQRSP